MKKHYEIKDPKAPATKGQLWFLHILTGENTRAWTLSKGEAAKQIATLKKGDKPKAEKPAPKKTILKPKSRPVSKAKPKAKPPAEAEKPKEKPAPAKKTVQKATEKPATPRKRGRPSKEAGQVEKPQKPEDITIERLKQQGCVVI